MDTLSFLATLTKALQEHQYVTQGILWEKRPELRDKLSFDGRRGGLNDIAIHAFDQRWSDTSCGWGGMAGQAFTTKEVVVIEFKELNVALIYIERLAYMCEVNDAYKLALTNHSFPGWSYLERPSCKLNIIYKVTKR